MRARAVNGAGDTDRGGGTPGGRGERGRCGRMRGREEEGASQGVCRDRGSVGRGGNGDDVDEAEAEELREEDEDARW